MRIEIFSGKIESYVLLKKLREGNNLKLYGNFWGEFILSQD